MQFQKTILPDPSNRHRIFKNFRDYLYSNPYRPYSSSELCVFSGASERTLQYAIKDYTGLTPAQYCKNLRLSILREELIKSNPGQTKITQLANEYGFWHTAQFATDYRNHFGELSSETLKYKI